MERGVRPLSERVVKGGTAERRIGDATGLGIEVLLHWTQSEADLLGAISGSESLGTLGRESRRMTEFTPRGKNASPWENVPSRELTGTHALLRWGEERETAILAL